MKVQQGRISRRVFRSSVYFQMAQLAQPRMCPLPLSAGALISPLE